METKHIEQALTVFEDTLRNHEHYAKYQISGQENMCRVAQVLKPDVLKVIVDALKRELNK